MVFIPGKAEILEAARRIQGRVLRTPLVYSDALSGQLGFPVYLKLESLQVGGSFKFRGATNAVHSLTEEEKRQGVVAASSGNYGTALALAASRSRIHAVIVLPENAPPVKVSRVCKAGGNILRHGAHYGDSEVKAAQLARKGLTLIHPFDDPRVVAGQGTIAIEIDEDAPHELEKVVVPVGGGGLIAGVALGLFHRRPGVEIIGVEPVAAPSLTRALEAGGPVPIEPLPTCADGLSPRSTGEISYEVARNHVNHTVLLGEEELLAGSRYCFHELKLVVEPSGAAGVAALLSGRISASGPIAVIVSGSNLDPKYYERVIHA